MGKFHIKDISAYEVLDSRGNPCEASEVTWGKGIIAKGKVPSEASTGAREAVELREGEKNRYNGKSVLKAISNVNHIIAPALIGKDSRKQSKVGDQAVLGWQLCLSTPWLTVQKGEISPFKVLGSRGYPAVACGVTKSEAKRS